MSGEYDFSVLRTLRQDKQLTLEQLAQLSGLSYPTIASIETNKTFPSLKTLDAIAAALNTSAGKLVSLAERNVVHTRNTESMASPVLRSLGINLENINVAHFEGLKIFRATARANEVVNSMKLHDNCDCHEVCYCLNGTIQITVKDQLFKLNANDVILFDGTVPHEYTALSDVEYMVIHLPKDTAFIRSLLKSSDSLSA